MSEEAAQAAYDVVRSGQLAMGPKVEELEKEWARLTETEAAAMVSSGLSSLRLALMAIGKPCPDPEVIIPAYSCVALHSAALSTGAIPVLCDIQGDLTIDPMQARELCNKRTQAVIAVHIFGTLADIDTLKDGAFRCIIEDMAHTGPIPLKGDVGISSFYPTKAVGSNGGGIVCGKKDLIEKVKDLRSYGNKEPSLRQNDLPNDVTAAIALVSLKNLGDTKTAKAVAALHYDNLLAPLAVGSLITLPLAAKDPYRYTVRVKFYSYGVVQAMQRRGVQAMQPVTDYSPWTDWPDTLPKTDEAFDRIVSLPFYPTITVGEQRKVVEILGECLGR